MALLDAIRCTLVLLAAISHTPTLAQASLTNSPPNSPNTSSPSTNLLQVVSSTSPATSQDGPSISSDKLFPLTDENVSHITDVNIMINQLAILALLNESRTSPADVAELREEVRQLEHEGRVDGHQLREEMQELRREKREEIQRIREEETEETQQLRDEVEMLREEGRRLKEEVPNIQQLLRNTMEMFIKLQDYVLDMEHEKAERDVQHQEQLAALNSTIASMFQHHHHLTALNTSITEHELESEERKGDIQRLQESLSVLNDSLLHTYITPLLEALDALRENQTSLWENVGSPALGQAAVREVLTEQREQIDILQDVTSQARSEIEEQKREIEEQKREIEEQKREIELLKEIKPTLYEQGNFHVNDDCSISVDQRGFLHPYQGSSAPNVSFSDLLAKNCIHLERGLKSWDASRANCVALGGDLFVAGDLSGAEQYLEQQKSSGLQFWPWVGVKRREWIDGRPVDSGEWDSGFPHSILDSCAFAYKHGLQDTTCSYAYTSLCVKGTTY